MKSLRSLLLLLPLLAVPSYCQIIANASLAADTMGEQAPLVTLAGAGTAVSVGVTSNGLLSCTTTYPQITFYVHRGASNLSLAVITTTNSSSWSTNTLSFNGLLTSDAVYAEITTAGSGCSNDVPLGVNFHYIPSAPTNICQGSPSPCSTLVGVLAGANGINAQDDVLSFQPNQWFFVAGSSGSGSSGIVVNSPTYCGTSITGAVVGVPDPLAQPSMSALMSGSLAAGTYFVEYSFYDYAGNETLVSPELSIVLGSTGGIQVNPPGALPSGVAGMRVYIGTASGTETLQGSTNGNAAYHQSTALTAGTAPLSSNTTLCKVVANDAGWPTGTGYQVSLSDQDGNTFPGYPMMWQILGANTTINLSNGVPYYHGVVTFPSPVLASPLNQATQSVNGSLSLGPFTLYAQRSYLGWYGPSGPVAGETDYIAGTPLANVPTGIVGIAAPQAAQPLRLFLPSSGYGTDGNALVQTSHDAFGNVYLGWGTGGGGSTGVSLENLAYIFTDTPCNSPSTCADLAPIPVPYAPSVSFMGPPQNTGSLGYVTNTGITQDFTGTLSSAVIKLPNTYTTGDTLVAQITADGSGSVLTPTDTCGNTWTAVYAVGTQGIWYAANAKKCTTADVITINFGSTGGFIAEAGEVVNGGVLDTSVQGGSCSGSSPYTITYNSLTTAQPDILVVMENEEGAGGGPYGTYASGSGFTVESQATHYGGGGLGASRSMMIEWGPANSAGVHNATSIFTLGSGGGGCSPNTSFTLAFKPIVSTLPGNPTPRLERKTDLEQSGDFPPTASGDSGKPLIVDPTGTKYILGSTSTSTAFSAITSGTNTSAAMVVGSGASLNYTGTGLIDSNEVNGLGLPANAFAVGTNASSQLVTATRSGNTAIIGTTSGTLTSGHCVSIDASGNLVDSGASCGTGSVTSVSGTANEIDSTGGATPVISLDGQYSSSTYGTCTNTADALTLTPAVAPTSLVNGLTVSCKSSAANTTTTPTLNVNSLGAKTIVKAGASGQAALAANDILTNMVATFKYNAATTTWELQNPQQASGGISSIAFPGDVVTPTTCSGPTCTYSKAVMTPGYLFRGVDPNSTYQTPYTTVKICSFSTQATTWTCQTNGSVAGGGTMLVMLEACNENVCGASFDSTAVTFGTPTDGTNTYTALDSYGQAAGQLQLNDFISQNITGGQITVSVSVSTVGGHGSMGQMAIVYVGNTASTSLDSHNGPYFGCNTCGGGVVTPSGSITTSNATDIVVGFAPTGALYAITMSQVSPWQLTSSASGSNPTSNLGVLSNFFTTAGSYSPTVNFSGSAQSFGFNVALKAAASSPSGQAYYQGPIDLQMLSIQAFPGLFGLQNSLSTGDTNLDLHQGTHYLATNVTTTGAQTLLTAPSGNAIGLTCKLYAKCYSAVATATVVPTLSFTSDDSASTVETMTGTTATCTTLGTNDLSTNIWQIRAKAGTSVTANTTVTNTPHFNADYYCEITSNQ